MSDEQILRQNNKGLSPHRAEDAEGVLGASLDSFVRVDEFAEVVDGDDETVEVWSLEAIEKETNLEGCHVRSNCERLPRDLVPRIRAAGCLIKSSPVG